MFLSRIRILKFSIPDPGGKKALYPGSYCTVHKKRDEKSNQCCGPGRLYHFSFRIWIPKVFIPDPTVPVRKKRDGKCGFRNMFY
jgi:hypothetical protein